MRRERLPLAVLLVLAAWLGAWSGDGWRVGPDWLAEVAGFQSVWAVGAFLTGLVVVRVRAGAAAGAAFGAVALGAYYLDMLLVQGAHSATSQLGSSGRFWWPAAVVGGAVMGAAGALARAEGAGRRFQPAAVAWALVAVVPLVEAAYVARFRARFASDTALDVAILLAVGLALALTGVRRTGRAFVPAAVLVVVLAPLAAAAFLVVEQLVGYATL